MNFWSRFLYGSGGFAMHASNFLIVTWLTKFYTPSSGENLISPVLFGYIFLVGRIVDAVTDPVVGYWSDHHEGKRGRRFPFIAWGAPFLAIFLIASFTPPMAHESSWNALYLLLVMAGFFFFSTIVVTPYLSLIPELTTEPKERIDLTTYQAAFVLVATIFVAVASGPLIELLGYFYFMLMAGTLVFLAAIAPLKVIEKKAYKHTGETKSGLKEIVGWTFSTLKNKPFRHVLLSTSLFWFGLSLLMAGVALWVTNVLGGKESDVALVMGPLIVSNIIGFILFNRLARAKGKYIAFVITLISMMLIAPIWFFVHRTSGELPFLQAMILFFLLGFPIAGFQVLPFAILADVIDHDEQQQGERREAIYFGMQAIVQKTVIGIAMVVLQYMRISFGESLALRLIGPIVGVSCLFGIFFFRGYSLREKTLLPDSSS